MVTSSLFRGLGLTFLLGLGLATTVSAQTSPVLHLINSLGQDAVTQLNSVGHFTTSFKGSNDVTITMTAGTVNSIFSEPLSASATQTNPPYLAGFTGNTGTGTGTGSAGTIKALETALGSASVTLIFDFSIPLTPQDRILLFDCDSGEQYSISAFTNQVALNLASWPTNSYSGQMNQLPGATWPVWTTGTTNGLLTAGTSGNLTEPLFVLTPAQAADRVSVIRNPVGGSLSIQFINLSAVLALQIHKQTTNAILNWSQAFWNYSLYKQTAGLKATNAWVAVTNVPALVGDQLTVTNSLTTTNTFYRLQLP